MNWIISKWKNLNRSTREVILMGSSILGGLLFVVGAAFALSSYDSLSDPIHHGIVRCQPVSAELGYCGTVQNQEDFRCYNGRFLTLVGHDGEGIIFYDENRRRVQLSNVSCIIQYDLERQ